jgi:hypothetical protein
MVIALASALRVAWFHNGTVTPLCCNASEHHAEQHLSIGRLQGLLMRSAASELMAVDNVDTARRANSADNSAPAAPGDSVPRKHERR